MSHTQRAIQQETQRFQVEKIYRLLVIFLPTQREQTEKWRLAYGVFVAICILTIVVAIGIVGRCAYTLTTIISMSCLLLYSRSDVQIVWTHSFCSLLRESYKNRNKKTFENLQQTKELCSFPTQ